MKVGCTLNNCENWTTADWETWGKLVKSWATSQNRLNPGQPPWPWPTTPHQLQHQLIDAGIAKAGDYTVPEAVLGVTVLQMSDQHIYIVLPAAADILEAEGKVCPPPPGDAYELPPFYSDLLNVIPPPRVRGSYETEFNNCRVGEYVISYCG